ncbi:TetR/AcrR family transcriptional regulator [Nonomuraea sp. NPDC003201]
MGSPEGGERESIVRTATRPFAALGFDGTSTEQIAEAAGLDTAALSAHFPTKRGLYLTVMEEAHRVLSEVIVARADELRDTPPERRPEALHRADAQFTTYTMIWCIHGFTLSGVLDGTGRRRHADDPRMLRRFRAHMHQLLDRALKL